MPNDQTIPEKVKGAVATFTVKVDGQAIPATYQVYSVTVIRDVNRIPMARLTIIDGEPSKGDFAVSAADTFLPGKEISISAGQQSNEDVIFTGVILLHGVSLRRNGSSQLKLECRDKTFKMTQGRKSAYYIDKKDSDIANDLLGAYKLSIVKIADTVNKHSALVQYDSSDWDFLLSRMDVNGKLVLVHDGSVEIRDPDFSLTPVLTLQHGATLHEFDAEMDARSQYAAVKAQGWDPDNQDILSVDASTPSKVKENGNFSSGDLAKVTGLDAMVLRHSGHSTREELQAWADACWQKSLLAKIRGRVNFDGFAGIKVGDLVKLDGLGPRFNGTVFVSGLRHDIVNGGWTTTAQFGIDPQWFIEKFPDISGNISALAPAIRGLHTGVVAQLEKDPAGEDRILVKIPMVGLGNDGIWARVATLDAGNNRGSFFRPDIDDEVLVGFLNDDPREAVVLGMLNSSKLPAPIQPKDKNPDKGFFFASKMKIQFNEDDKSMSFETPAGNKFTISEKDKGITLQDQNGNKLVLNSDGISLESKDKLVLKSSGGDVSLEGMNVQQKAQAQFKAEGAAGIEISSSALAKLKGSLVQIN
ncbi:MAG TPA: type VI secretion system tip protein VgrG [Puia sp.]|nr:type VI secretion system tip protein VgrG [Puia sp.]